MESVLLHAKLQMPPLLPAVLPRDRLTKRLQEGLGRRATFITAPAGYGKSTLVAAWAGQLEAPVGWLSLDAGDNDIFRFWNYVVSSIDAVCDGFGNKVRQALESLAPGNHEPFLVVLLNELNGLRQPLAFVFDDFHVIHDAYIIDSMTFFLEYLPANVHLYIASRKKAAFAKARQFSRGWAIQLDARDLRFDEREAEDLFRLWEDRNYPQEQIRLLVERTEGWVTGLKLAALAARNPNREPVPVRDTAVEGSRVGQYLLEEVFESLEPSLQAFLVKCSVLQRMSGPLCQAVTGDAESGSRLIELAAEGLFLVPLDTKREWFRFHHLFADFLVDRLLQQHPDSIAELYKMAASWSAAQGLQEDAVEYYLAGKHFPEAVDLLGRMKSFMVKREFSTLRHWLSLIPEPVLWEHRYLYFSYILSLLWDNEPLLAETYMQSAEERFQASAADWTEEERNRFLGNLYYLRNSKATQYDLDVVKGLEYIQLSLQHSPAGPELLFAPPHMPMSPTIFRSYNGKRGKHLPRELAEPFFRSMIRFLTPMRLHDSSIVCYGELLYERNELEEAEAHFKLGLQENVHNRYQPEKVYVPAYLYLSRIAKARGDRQQAELWLEEARKRAIGEEAAAALPFIEAELAGLRLDQGDVSAASKWREKYRVSETDPVSIFQLYTYTFLVRVLMWEERYEQAQALADRLFALAVKGHRPMDALELQVLQALLWYKTGKTEQAVLTMEQALKYAEPDEYIRVFADRGRPAAELLMTYIQLRRKGHVRESEAPSLVFVRKVLSSFGETAVTGASESRLDRLDRLFTKRETDIFRCMLEGMDNQAIADALGMGMGTLKTHINHIYGKLDVKSRIEAIRRGKELLE
ncbi:transcriptional regulator [Gordoniibacillus kamchatkensis]|uniref:Transcriptional regulator n=1 Tax=Gordoniibacillus kamchatkensis TaxID=1590651 RepID=A0ABR5AD76_9BACL|nr:LuxR C-terminal-related transcriptional regulator [Paenibacillus sp. VKM B-2647]KIL39000.1 transcriptional regulator [Paenibacillus sp. VKM B-2647]